MTATRPPRRINAEIRDEPGGRPGRPTTTSGDRHLGHRGRSGQAAAGARRATSTSSSAAAPSSPTTRSAPSSRPTPTASTPSAPSPATCSTASTTSSGPIEALRPSAAEGITAGLDMVHKQLLAHPGQARRRADRRARAAVRPQPARGPLQQPDAEHPEGTVVAELSKGYQIHDRVLRPSKVAVSVKPVRRRSTVHAEPDDPSEANPCRLTTISATPAATSSRPSSRSRPTPRPSAPTCKEAKLRRKIGPGAAILFKGSGFYQTDYRSDSYKKAARPTSRRAIAPAERSVNPAAEERLRRLRRRPSLLVLVLDARVILSSSGSKSSSNGTT